MKLVRKYIRTRTVFVGTFNISKIDVNIHLNNRIDPVKKEATP